MTHKPSYEELERRIKELEKERLIRTRTVEALRESEERFSKFFRASPIGASIIRLKESKYVDVNDAWFDLFGYAREEVIDHTPQELGMWEDPEGENELIKTLLRQGNVRDLEGRLRKKSGDIMDVRYSAEVIELGGQQYILGLTHDITKRKRAEEALRESEARLRQIIDLVPHLIFVKDRDGKFLLANKAIAEAYNTSPGDLTGKYQAGLHSNESERQNMSQNDLEVMTKGESKFIPEGTFTDAMGNLHFVQTTLVPFQVPGDKTPAVLGVAIDITNKKRVEEEVQRLSRHNQLILNAAGEGIVGLDPEGIVTFINPAGAELAGYRVEEMLHKDLHRMVHHSRPDGSPYPVHECPMFKSLTGGLTWHERDEVFWKKDGASFPVAYSSTPILEEGKIVGAVITFRDITQRKLAQEELNKYRDHLEDMIKESTSELAMANELLICEIDERKRTEIELQRAHDELDLRVRERTVALEKANDELRQIPSKLIATQEEERRRLASELHDSMGQTLAAVKFWVEMALKLIDEGNGSAASDRLEQFVPILQRSIEETRNIYMGLRPPMLDNAGLLATLEWLRGECMKLYPQRHIELEAGIAEEEIPESLKVNIFRIAQEALNNVAKHSEAEWVDISLSKDGGGIELVVSDDGVGMDLDTIMLTSTSTSLGLSSMRERAELTGGSFAIESTPGEGTTIRASWPIKAEDQFQKSGTA